MLIKDEIKDLMANGIFYLTMIFVMAHALQFIIRLGFLKMIIVFYCVYAVDCIMEH